MLDLAPVAAVSIAWLVFAGSHLALSTAAIRPRLVHRLGERGFVVLFTAVASLLFAALVAVYAEVRSRGPAGPALGASPLARPVLVGLIVLGLVLMTAAFAPLGYWRSPIAVLRRDVRTPYGLERVTRHPFFVGLVLFAGAHALLAPHLTGTVFFAGFVALSVFGAIHQDRKLAAGLGAPYAAYLGSTSTVPFAAILAGRQRWAAAEMPWAFAALGAVLALGLREVHAGILAWHGAPLSGTVVALSLFIGAVQMHRPPTPTTEHGATVPASLESRQPAAD